MAYIQQPGRYFLQVKEANWAKSDTGADYLFLRLQSESRWDGSAWMESNAQGLQITGYWYPQTKDGSQNQGFVKQMRAAFGFDGSNWDVLKSEMLVGKFVQAEIEMDPKRYGRMRVNWLDAESSTGEEHVKQVETVDVMSVAQRFASARKPDELPKPPVRVATSAPRLCRRRGGDHGDGPVFGVCGPVGCGEGQMPYLLQP